MFTCDNRVLDFPSHSKHYSLEAMKKMETMSEEDLLWLLSNLMQGTDPGELLDVLSDLVLQPRSNMQKQEI